MTDLAIATGADATIARSCPYLRRVEAAAYVAANYLPCSPKTLAKLAVVGGGPKYRKAGPYPLYSPADLDEWARGKIGPPVRSSSEARAIAAVA
jgi:hypothetical protein